MRSASADELDAAIGLREWGGSDVSCVQFNVYFSGDVTRSCVCRALATCT